MKEFIISIFATISLLALLVYDFLCICRILKKEKMAEKIWKYFLPNKPYNEKQLFLIIRPMFLYLSFMAFVLSGGVLSNILWYNIFLAVTPLLSLGVVIRRISSK